MRQKNRAWISLQRLSQRLFVGTAKLADPKTSAAACRGFCLQRLFQRLAKGPKLAGGPGVPAAKACAGALFMLAAVMGMACSSSTPKAASSDTAAPEPEREEPPREAPREPINDGLLCKDSKPCKEICGDIYTRKASKTECLALSSFQVERFKDIRKTFERPSKGALEAISADDFQEFVGIDLTPLEKLTANIHSSGARKILAWIAAGADGGIADVFEAADGDHKIFQKLLKKLDPDIKKALSRSVESGRSFIELAIDDGGSSMDWIHSFFETKCRSSSTEAKCMFSDWYCKAGLSESYFERLLDYPAFMSLLDDILDEYTTSSRPSWWKTNDEAVDAKDLQGAQIRPLCARALRRQ